MSDLIDDIGIDGKHSFENNIIPVADFQSIYSGRLAVLGGLDLNVLGAASSDEVRGQTRRSSKRAAGKAGMPSALETLSRAQFRPRITSRWLMRQFVLGHTPVRDRR